MLDRRIKLRHVEAFLEVARRRSLVRAAEALALSQPAVTKTLQELERILAVPLVKRDRRGATLTSFGEAFLPRASAAMLELEQAVRSVSRAEARAGWTARVGALPTVAARVMPRAILRFTAENPEASVALTTGPNLHLLELLRAGELDLVVGRLAGSEGMTELAFAHLYSEPVRLIVRPGHPLLERTPPDLGRLGDFVVILPDEGAIIRPAVDRLLMALGLNTPPRRVETVSTSFGRAFTLETDAVWIISHGVVSRELERAALVALDVDTRDTSGPVGLTSRAETTPSQGIERLSAAIRRAADELT